MKAKSIYLEPLSEMKKIMQSENSPLAEFAKVLFLSRLIMRIELTDEELCNPPFPYVANLINETVNLFQALMSISKFENNSKISSGVYGKEKNVLKKHEHLWQEIWPRFNEKDFQSLIDFRGARLDHNDINRYVKNKNCIDFGCGNGNFSFALLERGAKSVHGIYFGEKSIQFATEMAEKRGVSNFSKFETKEILDSKLPDQHYEFALCSAVLHHLATKKDMALAIKEIARVLKPGSGFFIFVTGSGAISTHVSEVCVEILSKVRTDFIEQTLSFLNLTREKMTHITDGLSATYLKTKPSELIEMLESAGFYEIRRLNSPPGDKTSWDINRVNNSLYGEERFGTGELRYFCVLQ